MVRRHKLRQPGVRCAASAYGARRFIFLTSHCSQHTSHSPMLIPHDYHMHSTFSCDCQAPMADMCQAAVALGIPEIGFTEHFDHHTRDECKDYFKLEPWAAELAR